MEFIKAPDDLEDIQRDVNRQFERARSVLAGGTPAEEHDDPREAFSVARHYGMGGLRGGGSSSNNNNDGGNSRKRRSGGGGKSSHRGGDFEGDLEQQESDSDASGGGGLGLERASYQARNHHKHHHRQPASKKKNKPKKRAKRRRGGSDDDEAEEASEAEEAKPPVVKRELVRRYAPDRALVLNELGRPDRRDKCFGCLNGRDDSVSFTFEAYKRMEAMFASKVTVTEAIDLARLCEEFYEEEIRKPANDPEVPREEGEQPLPRWSAATIYAHFTSHIVDFSIRRLTRIQMLHQVADSIYENGGLFNDEMENTYDAETGELLAQKLIGNFISPQQWKIFKDVLITEARLYGQNPRTAMFSWTGIGTTQDESMSLINMSKRRAHSRNVARLTGVSLANRGNAAGVGSTVQGTSRATSS